MSQGGTMSGCANLEIFGSEAALDEAVAYALDLRPITQRRALAFVALHHRHHDAPRGSVHHLAVWRAEALIGVALVGRPVARLIQEREPLTLEVTRCCVVEHAAGRHACSKLYAAARRFAKACGWRRLITYTLASESGASVLAAGFVRVRAAGGGSWSRPSRRRTGSAPTEPKVLYAWPG